MLADEIILLQGRSLAVLPVNYEELAAKREAGKLQPGRYYRIVDYVTTVANHENARSAGHEFDILVKAASAYDFLSTAYPVLHDGDTYYANCNLSEWKLKYCFDNDTTRFTWADTENGKGVIYEMAAPNGTKAPFDFTNIQFKRFAITDIASTSLTAEALSAYKETYVYSQNGGKCFATKDLYGNIVPQDINGTTWTTDEETFAWYYVFNGFLSEDGTTLGEVYDISVNPQHLTEECIQKLIEDGSGTDTMDNCSGNVIHPLYYSYFGDDIYYTGAQTLNDIVFVGGVSYCIYDEDSESWNYATVSNYSCTFKSNCYSITFGNDCYNQTFGNYCYNQTFGNNCGSQTFGNGCGDQQFGNECNNQTFGNGCYSQTFGNGCSNQTFGNNCYYQTFGNNCHEQQFGNDCRYQTFGNGCYNQTFGNNCNNQTFGNSCYRMTFGNYCNNQTFGNNCSFSTCFDGCSNTIVQDDIQNFQIYTGDYSVGGNRQTLALATGGNYTQVVALKIDGTTAIWNPADAA